MQKVAIRLFQHTVESLQGNLPELQQWRQSKSEPADSKKLQILQALREKEQQFPAPPVTIRKDVLEKARQIASTSPAMDSILSVLNSVLESLDRLSFNAFFMVVVWIGRICSHCCSPIGPPEYLRPDYWTHDPYSNLDRHLAVFFSPSRSQGPSRPLFNADSIRFLPLHHNRSAECASRTVRKSVEFNANHPPQFVDLRNTIAQASVAPFLSRPLAHSHLRILRLL